MTKLLISFLLVFFAGTITAQDSINVVADRVLMNINGKLYLIKGSVITEIDRQGNEKLKYALSPPDDIDYCDVSNPLEILIYNRSRNRVCILDDKLSPIYDNVSVFQNEDVSIVCSSSFGGMWYFGNDSRQIFHYDNKGGIKMKSQPFFGIPEYKNDLPVMLLETKDYLYSDLPETGLMVFDRNAQYIKTIPTENYKLSFAWGKYAILVKTGKVKIHDSEYGTDESFDISETVKQVFKYDDELILFDGETIFFRKLNKN